MTELTEAHSVIIERFLRCWLTETDLAEPLRVAAEYCLFPGGKRLRSHLLLSVAGVLGVAKEEAAPFAVAMELLHTASLVHDDLPGLDNDIVRRGKAACHCQFSEAIAILLGDALVAEAFRLGGGRADQLGCSALLREMAIAYSRLCSGQALDLGPPASLSELTRIHELKTGALFGLAAQIPALMARLPSVRIADWHELGVLLGIAFQLLDDVNDGTHGELASLSQEHLLAHLGAVKSRIYAKLSALREGAGGSFDHLELCVLGIIGDSPSPVGVAA